MNQKIIGLIDGNNFFVSCEVLMNPALKSKPVCVLSNNDGCVISRSYEAKKLGVPMGIPYFMAKKNFYGVTYLSANFTLYHELSERMINQLRHYSDIVDVYSIDEAFIDLTGADKILKADYKQIAQNIKTDIETNVGVSVSVGISHSKTLAKIASHKAKALNGTYFIQKHLIQEELQNLPLEEIWGIGKNIARNLRKYGIFYADEILLKEDIFYRELFGKKGMELKYELMGNSVIPLVREPEKPKSLQRTRAFPIFSDNKDYIRTELHFHLHNVCKKLREHNLETDHIAVMLKTKDFKTFYLDKKLDFSTSSEIALMKETENLFNQMFQENIIYRSSGIFAGHLQNTKQNQLALFSNKKQEKGKQISAVLDKLENKYGKGTISTGCLGIKKIMENHKRIANLH